MTHHPPLQQSLTLTAVIDRIIPADDYPSASENGVLVFLDRLLATDLASQRDLVNAGLVAIDAEAQSRHGLPFASLDADRQDALLTDIEANRVSTAWSVDARTWFQLLVRLTNEGYYADPGNGANLDRASWKMIGFDPRRPL